MRTCDPPAGEVEPRHIDVETWSGCGVLLLEGECIPGYHSSLCLNVSAGRDAALVCRRPVDIEPPVRAGEAGVDVNHLRARP